MRFKSTLTKFKAVPEPDSRVRYSRYSVPEKEEKGIAQGAFLIGHTAMTLVGFRESDRLDIQKDGKSGRIIRVKGGMKLSMSPNKRNGILQFNGPARYFPQTETARLLENVVFEEGCITFDWPK